MRKMTATLALTLLILLYLVGLFNGVLSYLSYKKISKGFCEAGSLFSCEAVYLAPEKYTKFLGVHFSVWAPIYFSIMLLISILYFLTQNTFIYYLLFLGGLVGLVFIPYLVYVEVKIANAICLYCTIMHIVIGINMVLIILYI